MVEGHLLNQICSVGRDSLDLTLFFTFHYFIGPKWMGPFSDGFFWIYFPFCFLHHYFIPNEKM
jgi:hypothetical protein